MTVRRVLEFRDDLHDAMEACSDHDKCTLFLIALFLISKKYDHITPLEVEILATGGQSIQEGRVGFQTRTPRGIDHGG